MCGRYSIALGFVELGDEFEVEVVDFFRDWRPTYNITPNFRGGTEQPIIVRSEEGIRQACLARWWFIPEDWAAARGPAELVQRARRGSRQEAVLSFGFTFQAVHGASVGVARIQGRATQQTGLPLQVAGSVVRVCRTVVHVSFGGWRGH